ncbi:hypothetical protein [Agromyces sp. Root81]|uniref:hypothetical protein n=1 Tax=Agromyces sp. Root81 TaxID=1736601 RepID=UPI0012F93D65|nr:hypothetical protein [Agromyces sp. Root81]
MALQDGARVVGVAAEEASVWRSRAGACPPRLRDMSIVLALERASILRSAPLRHAPHEQVPNVS